MGNNLLLAAPFFTRAAPDQVSFFDATVVAGDGDPNIVNATPGCLISAFGLYAVYHTSRTLPRITVVQNGVAQRRVSQRIPPSEVTGSSDAYVASIEMATAVGPSILSATSLNISTSMTSGGGETGPQLKASAVAAWGIAVRDGDGTAVKFTLAELNDSTEPYSRRGFVPAGVDGLSGNLDLVIVDRTDRNVDWDNLQFRAA